MRFFINKSNQKFLSKNGKLLTRYKYLVEKYPGIVVVWSMFKCSKDATVCQRIRESNTSTELGIGFNGNRYDESAYDAHVGEHDGFIRTWYDQSGNDYHFQQATAGAQPQVLDTASPYRIATSPDRNMTATFPSGITGTMVEGTSDGVIYYEVAMPTTYQFRTLTRPLNPLALIVFNRTLTETERNDVMATFVSNGAAPFTNWGTVTDFTYYWYNRSDIKTFPLIDTSSGTTFRSAFYNCSGLTSIPLLDTSSGTTFRSAFYNCSGLTSIPLLDVSNGLIFREAFANCSGLTSIPLLNVSNGSDFFAAFSGCSGLTSIPLLDVSNGLIFQRIFFGCSGLTSIPLLNVSNGSDFFAAFHSCSGLTSIPLLNVSNGSNFSLTFYRCSLLEDFPAGMFDSWTGTPAPSCFYRTWEGCTSLTATSVENILNSIDTSGQSAPAGTGTQVEITIDYDTGTGTPSISTAVTNLKSRGWQINLNGVLQ